MRFTPEMLEALKEANKIDPSIAEQLEDKNLAQQREEESMKQFEALQADRPDMDTMAGQDQIVAEVTADKQVEAAKIKGIAEAWNVGQSDANEQVKQATQFAAQNSKDLQTSPNSIADIIKRLRSAGKA